MSNIEYNIEEDIAYIEGVEAGEIKGEARGEKRGEIKKSIIVIQKMTAKKLAPALIAELSASDLKFVLKIQKQLLNIDKINALLLKKKDIETVAKKLKVNPILVEVIQEEIDKKEK